MSEECKEPTVVIPRAMIGTILINGLLGFGMIIALLFCMGDVNELFKSPVSLAGYPFIQIYYNAVQSLPGTNAMVCVSLVIVIMAHFGLMAGCSRTVWAFARDKGLPASGYLSKVGESSQVPFRAIMLSVIIQGLLGLINIGSYYAFSAFVNSAAVTLYITYVSFVSTINSMRADNTTDRASHPRPPQALAWRTHSVRTFPAWKMADPDQYLCNHIHHLHVFLPSLAVGAEYKCCLHELECGACGRDRNHQCNLVGNRREEEFRWT
jgi:amino acid transporter